MSYPEGAEGRHRFRGRIVGVGSTSGTRLVVGAWAESPFGAFVDVMVETAAGHRVLVAPRREVADFVAATYSFDEIRVEDVALEETTSWRLRAASLDLELTLGPRTLLGTVLRVVPRRLAESPPWCAVTDPVARLALRGVRTRGTAGGGRREWYGATDVHRVVALSGTFDGRELGALADVVPAPRFGFSSTPTRPTVTTLVTTVDTL